MVDQYLSLYLRMSVGRRWQRLLRRDFPADDYADQYRKEYLVEAPDPTRYGSAHLRSYGCLTAGRLRRDPGDGWRSAYRACRGRRLGYRWHHPLCGRAWLRAGELAREIEGMVREADRPAAGR